MMLLAWLTAPARWSGTDSIPTRVLEHLHVSFSALALAALLALPLGIYLGHRASSGGAERLAALFVNAANVGRALPSLALLALALPIAFRLGLGLGFWPTVLMLVPLGVPLILVNTYIALRNVDREVLEVARGLGMRPGQVLRRVQLPLALPVIAAGVRNAAVTTVATATLGALVAGGGLGRYIVDGLARREDERLLAGAALVALLSIATELVFAAAERLLRPGGLAPCSKVTLGGSEQELG